MSRNRRGGSSKAAWSSIAPGRYAEALKDFQTVAEGYATSTVADDAMLAIAEYQLDVAARPDCGAHVRRDAREAVRHGRRGADGLRHRGPGDAGARSVAGGPGFGAGQLRPRAAAVSAQRGRRAVAVLRGRDRSARRPPQRRPRQAAARRASSTRARRGRRVPACSSRRCCWPTVSRRKRCAPCSASYGATVPAPKRRRRAPGTRRSTALYIRAPTQPPYVSSGRSIAGPTGKLKDVEAIAIAPDGKLGVATRAGFLLLDEKGAITRQTRRLPTRARSPSTTAAGCSWCRRRSSGARPTRAWRAWRSPPRRAAGPKLLQDICRPARGCRPATCWSPIAKHASVVALRHHRQVARRLRRRAHHADGRGPQRRSRAARQRLQEHHLDRPHRQAAARRSRRAAPATSWKRPPISPSTCSSTFTCSTRRRSSCSRRAASSSPSSPPTRRARFDRAPRWRSTARLGSISMTMRRNGLLFTNKGARAVARAEGSRRRRERTASRCALGGGLRPSGCGEHSLLLLALCAPVFAQEPADLVEGRRLFDALEYDQALPFLDRAIGRARAAGRARSRQPHRAHLRVRDARPRAVRHGQPRGRRRPTFARCSASSPASRCPKASRRASSRFSTRSASPPSAPSS